MSYIPTITEPVRAQGRFYSTKEMQVLRERYAQEGVDGCLRLLPDRTRQGIHNKAATLGIRFKNQHLPRQHHTTSPWIDDQITALFNSGTVRVPGAVLALANRLGRPRGWVSKRARDLGLTVPRFKEPEWTPEELELLEQHHTKRPDVISRLFKRHGFTRSPTGIIVKRKRLGLSCVDLDRYSGRQLAALLKIDEHRITRWIETGALAAKRKGTARTESQHGDTWDIRRRDVREFLIRYPLEWDHRRCDRFWLIEILAGRVGLTERADAA